MSSKATVFPSSFAVFSRSASAASSHLLLFSPPSAQSTKNIVAGISRPVSSSSSPAVQSPADFGHVTSAASKPPPAARSFTAVSHAPMSSSTFVLNSGAFHIFPMDVAANRSMVAGRSAMPTTKKLFFGARSRMSRASPAVSVEAHAVEARSAARETRVVMMNIQCEKVETSESQTDNQDLEIGALPDASLSTGGASKFERVGGLR